MNSFAEFHAQMDALAARTESNPAAFEGARLLFSCGCRNMMRALSDAEESGMEARGVGRLHILVEIEDAVPDANWVATKGSEIAKYLERIGGTNPQISIDRNFE